MGTYLVTGGCGFIGSHLVESLLTDGHAVRVLDDLSTGKRENIPAGPELFIGDVADAGLVEQAIAGTDGCFHLAAVASVEQSNRDWLGTHRANLTGAITIFDAARRARRGAKIPVVYASSAATYGLNTDMPLTEASLTEPLSAYGADKLGCEHHARVATVVHGVPTVGMRFFNVYGPRQDPKSPYSGVISIFCDRFRLGQPVKIFGDGEQTRDFIYVGDVVAHLRAAMRLEPAKAEVFNVCTGRSTSIAQLAHTVAEVCGTPCVIDYQPGRAGEVRFSRGEPAKAVAMLGVRGDTDLRTGLARTLGVAPAPVS